MECSLIFEEFWSSIVKYSQILLNLEFGDRFASVFDNSEIAWVIVKVRSSGCLFGEQEIRKAKRDSLSDLSFDWLLTMGRRPAKMQHPSATIILSKPTHVVERWSCNYEEWQYATENFPFAGLPLECRCTESVPRPQEHAPLGRVHHAERVRNEHVQRKPQLPPRNTQPQTSVSFPALFWRLGHTVCASAHTRQGHSSPKWVCWYVCGCVQCEVRVYYHDHT